MALVLQLGQGTLDRATKVLPLTDDTGVYNNPANLGGFGAPNIERNTVALVTTAKIVGASDVLRVESDPLTDATWNYTFTSDGVYELYLVALPLEANPDVSLLAEDYVFYDTIDLKFYRVTSGALVETTSVLDGALYSSAIQYILVSLFSETRAIDMLCNSFTEGACVGLREEYCDLNRAIDSIKCYYEQGYYDKANDLFSLASKIKI